MTRVMVFRREENVEEICLSDERFRDGTASPVFLNLGRVGDANVVDGGGDEVTMKLVGAKSLRRIDETFVCKGVNLCVR